MTLYVPQSALVDIERDQQVDGQIGRAVALDAQLKELDPRLSLVWVGDRADDPDLVPGRWHVKMTNEQGANMFIPIVTEDGGYLEPNAGVVDRLRERDLQNHSVWDDYVSRAKRRREAREQADKEFMASQKDEFAGRVKALGSPGVPIGDDAWSRVHKQRKKR